MTNPLPLAAVRAIKANLQSGNPNIVIETSALRFSLASQNWRRKMDSFPFQCATRIARFEMEEGEIWLHGLGAKQRIMPEVQVGIHAIIRELTAARTALAEKEARLDEIERLRNHKPETPDDERSWIPYLLDAKARIATLEAELAQKAAECEQAIDSIRECRTFLRGCMNHAFDETPIVEVAKDVSEEFHRNRYQLQCMAKERDNIAKERDAANILLKRLMCVVVPDNAVPNDMKEFVRDSAATVLKDLWDYLKTDADLRKTEHDAK